MRGSQRSGRHRGIDSQLYLRRSLKWMCFYAIRLRPLHFGLIHCSLGSCFQIPGGCPCRRCCPGCPLRCHHRSHRCSCPQIRSTSPWVPPQPAGGLEGQLERVTIGIDCSSTLRICRFLRGNLGALLNWPPLLIGSQVQYEISCFQHWLRRHSQNGCCWQRDRVSLSCCLSGRNHHRSRLYVCFKPSLPRWLEQVGQIGCCCFIKLGTPLRL